MKVSHVETETPTVSEVAAEIVPNDIVRITESGDQRLFQDDVVEVIS